jgi:hypothetical protein
LVNVGEGLERPDVWTAERPAATDMRWLCPCRPDRRRRPTAAAAELEHGRAARRRARRRRSLSARGGIANLVDVGNHRGRASSAAAELEQRGARRASVSKRRRAIAKGRGARRPGRRREARGGPVRAPVGGEEARRRRLGAACRSGTGRSARVEGLANLASNVQTSGRQNVQRQPTCARPALADLVDAGDPPRSGRAGARVNRGRAAGRRRSPNARGGARRPGRRWHHPGGRARRRAARRRLARRVEAAPAIAKARGSTPASSAVIAVCWPSSRVDALGGPRSVVAGRLEVLVLGPTPASSAGRARGPWSTPGARPRRRSPSSKSWPAAGSEGRGIGRLDVLTSRKLDV